MTLEDFLKNNRKINEGENLPDELLSEIYENIKTEEFITPPRGIYLSNFNKCKYTKNIGMWTDLNKIQYHDKSFNKEIDSLLLLDMNDIKNLQLLQRTGCYVHTNVLTPILLKYVLKNVSNGFVKIFISNKYHCIINKLLRSGELEQNDKRRIY